MRRLIVITVALAEILVSVPAVAQTPEDKIKDFIVNCEEIQKCFDVKCAFTATAEEAIAPGSKGEQKGVVMLIDYRFARNSESSRLDVATYTIGDLLEPEMQTMVYSNLKSSDGKVWMAGGGDKGARPTFQGLLQHRVDPLSMLLLPVDNQTNGKGAVHETLLKGQEGFDFIETISSDSEEYGVWLSKNRKVVMEVGFTKQAPMPSSCVFFYVPNSEFPAGSEFRGAYREKGLKVSTCKMSWKKIGENFVPARVEMTRGLKGKGMYVTQLWDFSDWKLGKEVDPGLLDKATFLKGPSALDVAYDLRMFFVEHGLR